MRYVEVINPVKVFEDKNKYFVNKYYNINLRICDIEKKLLRKEKFLKVVPLLKGSEENEI